MTNLNFRIKCINEVSNFMMNFSCKTHRDCVTKQEKKRLCVEIEDSSATTSELRLGLKNSRCPYRSENKSLE